MFCSNCGTKLEDDSIFCDNCGQKTDNIAEPAAAAAEPIPAQPDFVHPYNPAEAAQNATINDLPPIRNLQAPSAAPAPAVQVQTAPAQPQPPLCAQPELAAPETAQPDFVHPYNPAEAAQNTTINDLPPIRNLQPAAVPQASYAIPVTAPEKKPRKKGLMALIIALIVLVVLGICFGIVRLFFWDSALRLVMGEKGYNKYIEQKSLTMLLPENEDTASALSSALKLSSGTISSVQSLYSVNAGEAASDNAITSQIANATAGNQSINAVLPYIFNGLSSDSITDILGANGAVVSVSPSIELGEYSNAALNSQYVQQYSEAANKLIALLNSIKTTYSFAADGDNLYIGTEIAAADSILANADVYKISDKLYIAFPYFTEKSFVVNIEENTVTEVSAEFEAIDSKEVEKLLTEWVDIYAEHVSALNQTSESSDYTVNGVTVSGTAIVTELTGADLKKIMVAMYEAFDKNEYFTNYILNYVNTYVYTDEKLTAEAYHDENRQTMDEMQEETYVDDKVVMRTKTIVDAAGEICGKIFEIVDCDGSNEGDVVGVFSILGTSDKVYGFEINEGRYNFGIYLNIKERSSTDGNISFTVRTEEGTMSFALDYTNVKQENFGKLDMWSGSLTFRLGDDNTIIDDLLTDEIKQTIAAALLEINIENADVDKMLDEVSITFENKINGNVMETACCFNLSGFGKLGGKMTTKLGCDKAVAAPSGVAIDIENMTDEETNALVDELSAYYKELTSSNPQIKDLLSSLGITEEQMSEIFSSVATYRDESRLSSAKTECRQSIMQEFRNLTEVYYGQNNISAGNREVYNRISDDVSNLRNEIANYDGSYDDFAELEEATASLISQMNELSTLLQNQPAAPAEDSVVKILIQNETVKAITDTYIHDYFLEEYPNYSVEYICVPDEEGFINEITLSYLADAGEYDIIIADSDKTARFAEQYGLLYSMNEIGVQINENDYYAGALNQARNSNGELMGVCFEFCPTVTMYRTDYAEQYLSITSPQEMQGMIQNMPNSITMIGEKLAAASDGKVKMFAGYSDIVDIYSAQKSVPWVNAAAMDTADTSAFSGADIDCLSKILTTIKSLSDSGSINTSTIRWDGAWADGLDEGVMFYTVPDWFLFSLHGKYGNYGAENVDKWACCKGWGSYVWGGDYLLVPQTCNSKTGVSALLNGMYSNDDFQARAAIEKEFFPAKIAVAEYIGANLNNLSEGAADSRYLEDNFYNTLLAAAANSENRNALHSSDLLFEETLPNAVNAIAHGMDVNSAIAEYFGITVD